MAAPIRQEPNTTQGWRVEMETKDGNRDQQEAKEDGQRNDKEDVKKQISHREGKME